MSAEQGNASAQVNLGAMYYNGYGVPQDFKEALNSKNVYSEVLSQNGFSDITTEIKQNVLCYPAEEYHQQYLAKNPNGYCGIKGTGCAFT